MNKPNQHSPKPSNEPPENEGEISWLATGSSNDSTNIADDVPWSSPRRTLQITVIVLFSSFIVLLAIEHPRWNWANCLGAAFATAIVAVVLSSIVVALRLLFSDFRLPAEESKLSSFVTALGIPMLIISPMLIIYQYHEFDREASDIREFDRMRR